MSRYLPLDPRVPVVLTIHDLNFLHDDVLAPGVSIGPHAHRGDEEYYYILSGRGTMTLDGRRFAVAAFAFVFVLSHRSPLE